MTRQNTRILKMNKSGKAGAVCKCKPLGPVPSLEEHVSPDWWRHIFNAMYLKTDADVVEDRCITAREIDIFSDLLQLKPSDTILDLCCGQGRHVFELARRGFNAEGIDRSRYLIQKAKSEAKKNILSVKFKEGDARKLPYPPDTFDVVMIMGNSFGYFETATDDRRVLNEVFRILKPWGRLLLDVTDGDYVRKHFDARSWEWIDQKMFVCRERSLSEDAKRLISREVITDINKGVVADQFYAERLYAKEELFQLLENIGFNEVVEGGRMATESHRNQDLGMMARRIILTAVVRKEWSAVKSRARTDAKKKVVVLFGDPGKPDPLKPSAVFDDDDLYTIDQLKDALRTHTDYEFSYLSNHDTLIQDLKRQCAKNPLILNLCDEGFRNDPRKELHIPALLELLGLSYTGASSQCLAFCYDKSLVRGIAKEMDIPVPEAFFVKPEDATFDVNFNFPVIVKPNFGDSSFGITSDSVAETSEQLLNAISGIRECLGYEKPILVEEFLTGKDISVGIIGNPATGYTVLPITEEDYSLLPPDLPRICGYEAKWLPESPYAKIRSIPANLPEETEKWVVECCLKLFDRLECRDYCRFDWRLNRDGVPKLLEVNPNPGWCWDGHLAKMAGYMGISYADMLRAILEAAEQRIEQAITLHTTAMEEKAIAI